jgi:hypothetical protein
MLKRFNKVHILKIYFSEIHFNNIFHLSEGGIYEWSLLMKFPVRQMKNAHTIFVRKSEEKTTFEI